MPIAYVLVNCELGKEDEIIRELKSLPGLVEIYVVHGVYDMIIKINTDTMEKLKETASWHIRKNDKIKTTQTLIVNERPK
jgi:DNA-binding Lrp family transcriptional regulator